MTVDTIAEDPRWEAAGLEALAARAAHATLAHLGLDPAAYEIALLAADDARIAALNAAFRGRDAPTNVLSWPSEERAPPTPGARPAPPAPGTPDDPEPLGDIALAWETCAAEAEAYGRPLAHHVSHLLVHGTLHLLGYDHETAEDALTMETIEIEVLAGMGLPNPY